MTVTELVLSDISRAEQARFVRLAQCWDAYNGRMKKPLKVREFEPDDNVRLNYARMIVDQGVAMLFGEDMDMSVSVHRGDVDENATEELDAAWDANDDEILLTDIATNGGVSGHVFLRIEPGAPYPKLTALDPATVSVLWAADDYKCVEMFREQWSAYDPRTGTLSAKRTLYTRADNGLSWRIQKQESPRNDTRWVDLSDETWPHDWAPILHCQNLPVPNEFWGRGDLDDDVLEIIHAINANVSNANRILRFHAHPKTWGSGFTLPPGGLDVPPDGVTAFPNPDAKLQNLEMQSDMSSTNEFIRFLKEALHQISAVPEIATGKVESIGALSGVALETLYRPLVQRTRVKRRLYGGLLKQTSIRMLELMGYPTYEIELHWGNPIPANAKEEAETSVILQGLGVSRKTLLERLGFDPEVEANNAESEQATAQNVGDLLMTQMDRGQVQFPMPRKPAGMMPPAQGTSPE